MILRGLAFIGLIALVLILSMAAGLVIWYWEDKHDRSDQS